MRDVADMSLLHLRERLKLSMVPGTMMQGQLQVCHLRTTQCYGAL